MTNRSALIVCIFVILCGVVPLGAVAVAPEDAPGLVIVPPSGDTEGGEKIAPSPSPHAEGPLPLFPVWMTILGTLFVAIAIGGFLLLRRPKEYEPRAKRLQK